MWEIAQKALFKDKYIGPLIKKYGDCEIRVRKHKDYFPSLCSSIINQQLSGRVADIIYERFEKLVGKVTFENVLKADDKDLRGCGMSFAKVAAIKDLANKTGSGELKTKTLGKLSDEEVKKELIAVRGIGNWTAEMFLMFTLGRADILPSDDLGIRNGLKKILGSELKREEMEEFSLRWKPYRTVASWYIWRNLDNR